MWPQSAFVRMPDRRRVQVQHGRFILSACLLRYRLLLVQLLTLTACLPTTNTISNKQNTALAIVRTSAPRETPLALKFSATIRVVESERTLSLLLGPTHRPPIFAFCVYPITTQMHCSCQFLSCRFKNFSPETLVTFLLRLFSRQITSLRLFVSPRTRAIHTWTTKHPITSEIQNG
jgi:hypothetical protein